MPGSSTILSRMQMRAALCGILHDPTQGPRFIRQWGTIHDDHEEFDIDVQVANGLPFIPTRAIQDGERGTLPEIELRSNTTDWDPSRFDTVSQDRFVSVQDTIYQPFELATTSVQSSMKHTMPKMITSLTVANKHFKLIMTMVTHNGGIMR